LSITHHTRKRSSTGPRTTHGPHWTMTITHVVGWYFLLCKISNSNYISCRRNTKKEDRYIDIVPYLQMLRLHKFLWRIEVVYLVKFVVISSLCL
jgi:hypothetical protein